MTNDIVTCRVAFDQLDYYIGSVRYTNINVSNLSSILFVNNVPINWPLCDGSLVPDSSVSSGHIYFNQISGAP